VARLWKKTKSTRAGAAAQTSVANAKPLAAAAIAPAARTASGHAAGAMISSVLAVLQIVEAAVTQFVRAASTKMKGVRLAMKNNLTKSAAPATPPTVLRFSPTAWAKLLYLRDAGNTEVGGFGISAADDLLFVTDVELVSQICTWTHVEFDDLSVADHFDRQVDAGRRPEQFGRIWIHTHPGNSADPSGVDEATFERVFGRANWAVMFILARGGQTFARLRYNLGPGCEVRLPTEVSYARAFGSSNHDAWQAEFNDSVQVRVPRSNPFRAKDTKPRDDLDVDEVFSSPWDDYNEFDRYPREAEHGFIDDYE
jgi:hypothetical protein